MSESLPESRKADLREAASANGVIRPEDLNDLERLLSEGGPGK